MRWNNCTAAHLGDVKEIRRLLAAGCSTQLFAGLHRTPLHHAVEGEQYLAAELLLAAGAPVNAHAEDRIVETS